MCKINLIDFPKIILNLFGGRKKRVQMKEK